MNKENETFIFTSWTFWQSARNLTLPADETRVLSMRIHAADLNETSHRMHARRERCSEEIQLFDFYYSIRTIPTG